MFIRISFLLSLIMIWIGINNLDLSNLYLIAQQLLVPLFIYFCALKLDLIPKNNHFKLYSIIYIFWLIKEILMSSLQVIKIALQPNIQIIPVLDIVKSTQTNPLGTYIYANSITITPGTVTLNIDNQNILVHALNGNFMNDLQNGQMDDQIKKIMKKYD